ncbi:MAG: nitric oxide reductase [Gammaproteobacteria bacterium]|nr:nitric oxide reductase [Gammaproteobacteria bacterium]
MEEWVGGIWDRYITRRARRDHPQAAVRLAECEKTLGVLYRALGGDPGVRVAAVGATRHGARRRLLSRIAGTDEKAARAAIDGEALRLPPEIAVFRAPALNRDLYLWLVALAAHYGTAPRVPWIVANQQATLAALARYPGLTPRYRLLVEAVCAERLAPAELPVHEAAQEMAIRQALRTPGSVTALPVPERGRAKAPQPVPLWLHPVPAARGRKAARAVPAEGGGERQLEAAGERREAERIDTPERRHGLLLMFRAESLLAFADFIKVDRAVDDDPNPDAGRAAAELDTLAIAADAERVASKVRFDLDLPAAVADDVPLGPGIPVPEWDYRQHRLLRDHCRVQPLLARHVDPRPLPEHLRRPAKKLASQFAALAPVRRWQRAQPEGTELDLEACVRRHTDRAAGCVASGGGLYLQRKPVERDLACLVLADLSLSTDAWVSEQQRVIDVVGDSLLLLGEALRASGDRYALYGFSSLRRDCVRLHEIKSFDASFDATARGRIAALKPGYYTRMGAALRHATTLLAKERAAVRLLLLLSDGKPHDIDCYEGRYGIEDTRVSLVEARAQGVKPFCVTIDREGAAYLPHLFGPGGFTVLRKPEDMPARLPLLYAQLTQR